MCLTFAKKCIGKWNIAPKASFGVNMGGTNADNHEESNNRAQASTNKEKQNASNSRKMRLTKLWKFMHVTCLRAGHPPPSARGAVLRRADAVLGDVIRSSEL